jgi:hypothetical protein
MPNPKTIVAGYTTLVATLRARIVAYVNHAWGSLDTYRDADIDRFVNLAVPVVAAGQRQVASLTDAYLASLETTITGRRVRPVGVPASAVTNLRGVPTDEVYRRAGVTTWLALSEGADLATAAARGLDRAQSLAATDVQMAKTAASKFVLDTKTTVTGYRRTLSGGDSCGLCLIASQQRYRRDDLMPIHPGCNCGVEPIYGTRDPGPTVDDDQLAAAGDAIAERLGSTTADRAALIVHEHGEIGPVLAIRGHAFTGPNDL